jgi:hypothetical protein
LIDVPDLDNSPFDILVADHATHFNAPQLRRVVAAAGFETCALESGFVPKELSLFARCAPSPVLAATAASGEFDDGVSTASAHIAWLHAFLDGSRRIPGTCGIFGSSISATWLAASLGEQVTFFVDEDHNRIGRHHMGRPIYHPGNAPRGSSILMPMRDPDARAVAKRIDQSVCRFVVPPSQH